MQMKLNEADSQQSIQDQENKQTRDSDLHILSQELKNVKIDNEKLSQTNEIDLNKINELLQQVQQLHIEIEQYEDTKE